MASSVFHQGSSIVSSLSTGRVSSSSLLPIRASVARKSFPGIDFTSTSQSLSIGSRRPSRVLTCRSSIAGGTGELTPELKEALDSYVKSNKVVLFMKGTKLFPQCGFSNTVVQILNSLNVPFETVNILENEGLRSGMKIYSNWPTFPQLYIDGEFFGGCDITLEAYKSGELQETIEKAMCS